MSDSSKVGVQTSDSPVIEVPASQSPVTEDPVGDSRFKDQYLRYSGFEEQEDPLNVVAKRRKLAASETEECINDMENGGLEGCDALACALEALAFGSTAMCGRYTFWFWVISVVPFYGATWEQ